MRTLYEIPPWDWPADAGETLLAALKSRTVGADDPDRLLAAELAGNLIVMNDDIAGVLLDIIRDPAEPAGMRGAAAIALGPALEELHLELFDDIEGPVVSEQAARAIREGLRQAYQDADAPKEVRRRALEASVRAEADWHAGAVRAAYDSGDDEWRLTAVFCMSYVAGFEREIEEALESDDPILVYEAVRAAGNRGVEAAWPRIRELILLGGEGDRSLLLAAIDAVPTVMPEEAEDALVDLSDSDDAEIAEAATDAIVMARGLRGRD